MPPYEIGTAHGPLLGGLFVESQRLIGDLRDPLQFRLRCHDVGSHLDSKLRDEFLNGEIFYSIKELRVLAERWRVHYNTIRPHSSLGYRPPAPEAWLTSRTGHGEAETATRFPLLHSPDGGYLNLICPGNFRPVAMLVFGKI